jgi:hypothetical protein
MWTCVRAAQRAGRGVGGIAPGGARSAFGQAFGGFVAAPGWVLSSSLAGQRLKGSPRTRTEMSLYPPAPRCRHAAMVSHPRRVPARNVRA